RKDDQRLIAFTGSFKSFDNAADLIIHVRDRARVMLAPDILENFFVGSNPFRWLVQGIVRSMVCHIKKEGFVTRGFNDPNRFIGNQIRNMPVLFHERIVSMPGDVVSKLITMSIRVNLPTEISV